MFNFIKQLARKGNVVRCDNISPACNTLYVSVVGISNTAEEVDDPDRCVIRAGLKVENNNPFLIEHICNRADVLVSVQLLENYMSLGGSRSRRRDGRTDIDNLAVTVVSMI